MNEDTFSVYPEVVSKDVQCCWNLTGDESGAVKVKEEGCFICRYRKSTWREQAKPNITTGGDNFMQSVNSGTARTMY